MSKIFISHSSKDNEFVRQLCEDLRLIGHEPWVDFENLKPSDPIVSSIQDGMYGSRDAIVVVSQSAIQSNWVDREWKEKYWDSLANQKVRVIPVLLEICELPAFLRTLYYADFSRSYSVGFAQLCLTLRPVRSQVPDILDINFLHAIEYTARTHPEDHIRLACAHTVWSCNPLRAIPILQDALNDQRDVVRDHARILLEKFY